MEAVLELGAVTLDHIAEQPVFDRFHDRFSRLFSRRQSSQYPAQRDYKYGSTSKYNTLGLSDSTQRDLVPWSSRRLRDQNRDRELFTIRDDESASEVSDRIARTTYEREVDDPLCTPSILLSRQGPRHQPLNHSSKMASSYGDGYNQTAYRSRSSQPARSRYYDDDEGSDYDEHTGRRSSRGRGYADERDDRDYDIVREETERYRGPTLNRPQESVRRESYRSGNNDDAGAVATYGRRSDNDYDRSGGSHRSKSRGRDRDRDYDRDDRSESGDRRDLKDKLEGAFDLSPRGLGVGIAGALIGGFAGRELGKEHKQRDAIIGAIVGGLGANAAENKWREKRDKRRSIDRDDQLYDYGRSRSSMR